MVKESKDPGAPATAESLKDHAEKTYYSISETAERLNVRPHVLRYWETQFPLLKPRKGRSGSRMYRAQDLELLGRIKSLLYDKGFTIKGARRRIRLEHRKDAGERQLALGIENPWLAGLEEIRDELIDILRTLRSRRHPRH